MKHSYSKIAYSLLVIIILVVGVVSFQNCSRIQSIAQQGNLQTSTSGLYDLSSNDGRQIKLDESATDIDQSAADCTATVLQGYKCLDKSITTSEGKTYGVRIKWNRIGQISRGSFISVSGGTGKGEALDDATFKMIVDKLDVQDQVRAIFIEFTDDPKISKDWGGCWSLGGGYRSAGLLFHDVVKLIVEDLKIPRGDFLNYLGLSNGSMLLSYGISFLDMDKYFDRVVLHAAPIMASAVEACDANNPKSIVIVNTKEKADYLLQLFSEWLNGDGGASMCANIQNDDRMSVLGPKRSFPNLHIYTLIGGAENVYGFGNYHIVSNEDWFNKISAQTKLRLVPEFMGHMYSYKDIRRFLRLGKNDTVQADTDCVDQESQVCEGGYIVRYVTRACMGPGTQGVMAALGWQDLGLNKYKHQTSQTCTVVVSEASRQVIPYSNFALNGYFYGNGSIITRRDQQVIGAGPNVKVCLGRNSVDPNGCSLDSEFKYLKDVWGAGSYNVSTDTFSIKDDLSYLKMPYENYFAVFILSDGVTRRRIDIVPKHEVNIW